MSQTSVMLQFEIVRDGQLLSTEQLDLDVIKVGKLSSSHLRLDDPNVSRIHAVIERGGDGNYTVIDLGSASGTFLNGEKVTKSEIRDGDELRFGDTIVNVRFVANQPAVAASPAMPVASAPAGVNGAGEAAPATAGLAAHLGGELQQAAEQAPSDRGQASSGEQYSAAGYADGGYGAADQQSGDVPAGHIQLPDGSVVQPYEMQGYYDEYGNYHPGYYDEYGQYHSGYGFHDETGQWQVLYGYYDPSGEWVATAGVDGDDVDQGPSDTELFTDSFFSETGGDTLEIALLWCDHVLNVTSYTKPRTVHIGPGEKNDFVVEDESLSTESFPLVVFSEGAGYALTLLPNMQGLIQNGDQQFSVQEVIERGAATPSADVSGAYSLPIGARTSVRLEVGSNTFLVHFTSIPALVGASLPFDKAPLPYLAASTAAHLLFLLLALTTPDRAGALNLDGFDASDRFVQLLVKPEQEEEPPKPDWLGGGDEEEEAAKHKGDEGVAGKEDSTDTNKQLAIEGDRDPSEVELRRIRDTEVAMSAGALAVFNDNQVGSLWGSGDSSIGSDAIHALGNMTGDGFGEARGMGGLGLHGSGRGGGGVSERGIGLANVGTAGRGGGGGSGKGYGRGAANMEGRKTIEPKIVPGRPNVQGSLDREIIQRVVRQHRREITHCYETELQKNRNLAGRVTVRFTISANGSIVSAVVSETSLNNAAVERCMTDRIRRWVFPEPKGGGIVIVNYPFNFSS